jgi:hypothetical protein
MQEGETIVFRFAEGATGGHPPIVPVVAIETFSVAAIAFIFALRAER